MSELAKKTAAIARAKKGKDHLQSLSLGKDLSKR
jgi:hypothetical protein